MRSYPDTITDVEQLEDLLSVPTEGVIEALRRLDGDVLILGAAGKMGPTLARMVKRACGALGDGRRVIAVSRFTTPGSRDWFQRFEIETLACDLLQPEEVADLPDAPNIIYMAGMKFGSTGNESLTWAMNSWLPGAICRKYRDSRIAAFSTGNVYGESPVALGGSVEADTLQPVGEYAMSCLGRERLFEHFSLAQSTRVSILRLNYAVEMRYGVPVDIARKVWANEPVDVAMGCANILWQGDANAYAIQSLSTSSSPACALNLAGPETMSVRRMAERFAQRMGREVRLTGVESGSALLSNAQTCHRLFGYPRVCADLLLDWVADWVMRGGVSLNKPTHFEVKDGKF